MKATAQHFFVMLFIILYEVVLTFESLDIIYEYFAREAAVYLFIYLFLG